MNRLDNINENQQINDNKQFDINGNDLINNLDYNKLNNMNGDKLTNQNDNQIELNNKLIKNIQSTELNNTKKLNLINLNDNLENSRKRGNNSIMIDGEIELIIQSEENDFEEEINEDKKEENLLTNINISPKQSIEDNNSKKSGCSTNCECNLSCDETSASFSYSTRSSSTLNEFNPKTQSRKSKRQRSSSSEFIKSPIKRKARSRSPRSSSSSEFIKTSNKRKALFSSSSSESTKTIRRDVRSRSSSCSSYHSRRDKKFRRSSRSRSLSSCRDRSMKKTNRFRPSYSSYTNPNYLNYKKYEYLNRSRSLSPHHNESAASNNPIYSFEESNLNNDLIRGINLLDIYKPNSLQRSILPVLMNKNKSKDIFVKSRPHSGKKTAFLISNIYQLNENLKKPQLIIVTPTGELVLTIFEYARNIVKYTNIKVQYILRDTDNEGINEQIVIGTIGAILELLRQKSFDKSNIKTCIFDEADILLSSASNCYKISKIVSYFKGIFQLQYYSTFFGDECLKYIQKYLSKKIMCLSLIEKDKFLSNLLQFSTECENKFSKLTALVNIIEYSIFKKMAIFVTGKEEAYQLFRDLERKGYKSIVCLSSTTPIDERLTLIRNFKRGHNIIIINYPLTHGVDLGEDVSIVVNYDLPTWQLNCNYEYFHRISKCGRTQNKPGFIVNLIDSKTRKLAKQIENFYNTKFIDLKMLK